jgi:hemolysin activation/secretion protein
VKKIRVDGVTVFHPARIDGLVSRYENRNVTSAELQSLRVELTRLYVDNGYVNSGVVLPDQEVQGGVIAYRAVEGRLTDVEIVTDQHLRDTYVSGRVHRYVSEPLNVNDLQDALRYLQFDPNVQRLDARLAPGAQPGDGVLRLSIEEKPRFTTGVGVNNHHASSTGAEQAIVFLSARDLTGFGDQVYLSYGRSDGSNSGSAIASLPISARNTRLQLYYTLSNDDIVEERFRRLDITSETQTWGGNIALPFVENVNGHVEGIFGFEARKSESRLLGVPFSFSIGAQDGVARDAVGILGADWLRRGTAYVSRLQLTYRHGFDALDATVFEPETEEDRLYNPTGADALFDLGQVQGTYILRLNALPLFKGVNDRAQFVLRGIGQFTQDPLLSMEKLAIGGVNTVRGYPENLMVRDNGFAASLEFQVPLFGFQTEPGVRNLVFVPFTDYGRSWDVEDTAPASSVQNTDQHNYIWSAGLGLLWQPWRGLDFQLYWGAKLANNFGVYNPLDYREKDLQDDGISFAVNYVAHW